MPKKELIRLFLNAVNGAEVGRMPQIELSNNMLLPLIKKKSK